MENYLSFLCFQLSVAPNALPIYANNLAQKAGWDNIPNMKNENGVDIPLPYQENVDSYGRRYIGRDVPDPQKRFLFLGCSYTFGSELKDQETYLAKTARRFTQWQFDNYAVCGYGTQQCRMKQEMLLSNSANQHYDGIFYAFIHDHLRRNIYNNLAFGKDRALICSSKLHANGKAAYFGPGDEVVPGCSRFRVSAFFNKLYFMAGYFFLDSGESRKYELLSAILSEMVLLADKHGAKFTLIVLDDMDTSKINPEVCGKMNIFDIRFPELNNPKYHVANSLNHHPNNKVQDYWCERLSQHLCAEFGRD
ncbi:MAG: hypothetical protein K6G50_12980 [bacterium]|nr:hypothetical protein [bacterium]